MLPRVHPTSSNFRFTVELICLIAKHVDKITLPETNMAPENKNNPKRNFHLPAIDVQGLCLKFHALTFREGRTSSICIKIDSNTKTDLEDISSFFEG